MGIKQGTMMDRFWRMLCKPGAKVEITAAAPTQRVHTGAKYKNNVPDNVTGYNKSTKARMLDRWLDSVVRASGSEFVFFTIIAGLLAWALLGIRFGKTATWQVLISDVQAILSYIFDSFLVRQQLNMYDEGMAVAAMLQSRILSYDRMLQKVRRGISKEEHARLLKLVDQQQETLHVNTRLPAESKFGRVVTYVSHALGHPATICLFWAGVFVWIGIGPLVGWSNDWQLYMNSASSALMVFTFAFLANIGERHIAYTNQCLDLIFNVDSTLELRLRSLTNDTLENDPILIPAPKMNKVQRAIFYYADFVGTLVGIALLATVFIVWLCLGPLLHFSSSWWLLIGTYAGLVGMNDGFVLRNMQSRLEGYVDEQFRIVEAEDNGLFRAMGLPAHKNDISDKRGEKSLHHRISDAMNAFCAHELTVIACVLTIVGLVAGATAMRWTLTGQLLCNVPPSLIESFIMIILITGHNSADDEKRLELRGIYERRLRLLSYANAVQEHDGQTASPNPECKIKRSRTSIDIASAQAFSKRH